MTVPDFELNLGLARNVELDVDGAFTYEPRLRGTERWNGDALWTSLKLGLLDWHLGTRQQTQAIAVGLQLGPRLPTYNSGKGVGYAALGLLGYTVGGTQIALNAGYAIEPGAAVGSGRPSAFQAGLDLCQPLRLHSRFALLGELAAVRYVSPDPYEFNVSAGLAYTQSDNLSLSLSLIALAGRLPNGDHVAVLLGISPSFALF